MRPSALLRSILSASALLVFASGAQAYCRTTTAKQESGCPAECQKDGLPLYWPTAKLDYAFNERLFPGFSEAELRDVIAQSFGAWEEVVCDVSADDPAQGQAPVGLEIVAMSGTTSLEVGPQYAENGVPGEPNDNVVVWFSGQSWLQEGFDPHAFALTSVWFDTHTGQILGADMHFNGAMNFTECPDTGCSTFQNRVDLRNVATHEAGHFLGLSHSDEPDSTMWCDARPGDVDKRSLSQDDIDGLCAIYPPGKAFPDDNGSTQTAEANTGCSAVGGGASGAWGSLAALALSGLALLRRRRR